MSVTVIYHKKGKKHKKKKAKKIRLDLIFSNIKIYNIMAFDANIGTTGTLVVVGENDANEQRPITVTEVVISNPTVVTATPIDGTTNYTLNFIGNGTADITVKAKNAKGEDLPDATTSVNVVTPVQEATHLVLNITQP